MVSGFSRIYLQSSATSIPLSKLADQEGMQGWRLAVMREQMIPEGHDDMADQRRLISKKGGNSSLQAAPILIHLGFQTVQGIKIKNSSNGSPKGHA